MKTLYIVRHAKSSWDMAGLSDFDRPLNERGKNDAPHMGKRLKKRNIKPDLLLTSPAKRAWSTSKRIAEELGYSREKIKTDRALYHADEQQLLSVIKEVNDKYKTLMIFGHNPGLTDFVNLLRDDRKIIDNLPTCGVVSITFNILHWREIKFGSGKVMHYDYPKNETD